MALTINVDPQDSHVSIHLAGQVDTKSAPELLDVLTQVGLPEIAELRIHALELTFLSSAGLRALVFAKQKMPHESRLVLIGAAESIGDVIQKTGLTQAVMLVASHDEIA